MPQSDKNKFRNIIMTTSGINIQNDCRKTESNRIGRYIYNDLFLKVVSIVSRNKIK